MNTSAAVGVDTGRIVPLLFVEHLQESVRFYEQQLGFRMIERAAAEHGVSWCRIARGSAELMLQEACDEDRPVASRGGGVVFYIHCNSADAVHAELTARGLQVDPPQTAYYGMRQFYLQDPDGYRLCFQNPVPADTATG